MDSPSQGSLIYSDLWLLLIVSYIWCILKIAGQFDFNFSTDSLSDNVSEISQNVQFVHFNKGSPSWSYMG